MGKRWGAAMVMASTVVAGACGSGGDEVADRPAVTTTVAPADVAAPASGEYVPVSDVAAHAAIGLDAREIRALLEPATSGGPVDWSAVGALFTGGKNSPKTDGLRTLASLASDDPATTVVTDAIAGTGSAAGAGDAVRRQKVDKGITVILERKVLAELAEAADKVAAGKVDAASGAPHNVDEAWAFYTAEGQGPASTAAKRAGDFAKTGKVHEPVIAGLVGAQAAALAGNAAALKVATAEVEAALDYVFYLATFKYLDTKGDPVTRAEGETFYLGIRPELADAAGDADKAITDAFGSGAAEAGRAALNGTVVLPALGITDDEKVAAMP